MHNRKGQTILCKVAIAVTIAFGIPSGLLTAQTSPLLSDSSQRAETSSSSLAQVEVAISSGSEGLPDAPSAQIESQQKRDGSQPAPEKDDHTRINPMALLSPRLISGAPLTVHDKFDIYFHKTYSPAAVVYPLFSAGIRMARPNDKYPPEWQHGMGAFGRNYGDTVARRTAKTTAELGTQLLLHEDPRYQRSDSSNPLLRIGHAVGWTFIDESDSGHRMIAASTFTGAAAGSFVGMSYLPDGFNDTTHAEQRMAVQLGTKVFSNILTEFEPTWGPWARKLHVLNVLPGWWIPERRQHP
jgi:hypothetical protein